MIRCNCILPQFVNANPPLFHMFPVFSLIDNDDNIIQKTVSCSNCGATHIVTNVCESKIAVSKDLSKTVRTIDEIEYNLPERVTKMLKKNNVSLATWEEVEYIIENELWNSEIILSREIIDELVHVKILKIINESRIKIESIASELVIN